MTTLYQNAHSRARFSVALLKNFDVIVAVVGGVIALALGAPALGCVVGVAGWVLQRAVQLADRGLTLRLREPRTALGVHMAEAFGRIWLLAGAIVLAGVVGSRADGLTAAIVIFCAYSLAFAIRMISGPPPERTTR